MSPILRFLVTAAFDPDFAVFEEFLLPDGNDFLEFVDGVMAGVERGTAMGGSDDDGDAGFADIQMAETVDDGNAADLPGLANEYADLFELLQSHRLVTLVHKMQRPLPFRIVPNDAFENANRAIFGTKHFARDLLRIDRIARDLIQLAGPADRQTSDSTSPPLTGGKIATSSPSCTDVVWSTYSSLIAVRTTGRNP